MNKKTLFVLPLSLLAIACAPRDMEITDNIDIPNCDEIVIVGPCTGPRDNPTVTINVSAKSIVAAPPNVCAAEGEDIVFTIVPPNTETKTVAVIPKNPLHIWLIGTNFPDGGEIIIPVPDTLPEDDYNYTIITSDGKCLDPRIHVN